MSGLSRNRLPQLCEVLRLSRVAGNCPVVASAADEQGQGFSDFLESMLPVEHDFRRARCTVTLVRMAGFPAIKTLEEYHFKFACSGS
jgi:hypothetical protein